MMAIERFGASAPATDIFEHFGFTPEHVAARRAGRADRQRCAASSRRPPMRTRRHRRGPARTTPQAISESAMPDAATTEAFRIPDALRAAVEAAIERAVERALGGADLAARHEPVDDEPEVRRRSAPARLARRAGALRTTRSTELRAFAAGIAREGIDRRPRVRAWAAARSHPRCSRTVYPRSAHGHPGPRPRLDRPGGGRAGDRVAPDPAATLYIIATKSGTTTETLAFLAHFWAARARRAPGGLGSKDAGDALRRDHRPRPEPRGHPPQRRFPRDVPQPARRGRPLQRADLRRPRAGRALGPRPRRRCWPRRPRWPSAAGRPMRATRASALGAAMGALARPGATSSPSSSSRRSRRFGAWLEQLDRGDDRQARHGHRARRRRAAGRARRLRSGPRVRAPRSRRPTGDWRAETDAALDALRRGRPPGRSTSARRRRSGSAASSSAGSSRPRSPGRCWASTPSTSPTSPSPSRTQAGARAFHATARSCRSASRTAMRLIVRRRCPGRWPAERAVTDRAARAPGGAANGYLAIQASSRRRPTATQRLRAVQAQSARPDRPRDDAGLRPALPALDRPAPQGRPAARAASSSSSPATRTTCPSPGRKETFGVLIDAQALGDFASLEAQACRSLRIHLARRARTRAWRAAGLLERRRSAA